MKPSYRRFHVATLPSCHEYVGGRFRSWFHQVHVHLYLHRQRHVHQPDEKANHPSHEGAVTNMRSALALLALYLLYFSRAAQRYRESAQCDLQLLLLTYLLAVATERVKVRHRKLRYRRPLIQRFVEVPQLFQNRYMWLGLVCHVFGSSHPILRTQLFRPKPLTLRVSFPPSRRYLRSKHQLEQRVLTVIGDIRHRRYLEVR